MMKAMSTKPPPTVPPTTATKLEVVEGAAVSVGDGEGVLEVVLAEVLVDELEVEEVDVTEIMDTIGVLLANAP